MQTERGAQIKLKGLMKGIKLNRELLGSLDQTQRDTRAKQTGHEAENNDRTVMNGDRM